jgi:hypothetical protein
MPQEDRDTMPHASATAIAEKVVMDVIFPSLASAGVEEGDDYETNSAKSDHLPKGQCPSLLNVWRSVRFSHRTQNQSSSPTKLSSVHSIQVRDDIYQIRTQYGKEHVQGSIGGDGINSFGVAAFAQRSAAFPIPSVVRFASLIRWFIHSLVR